MSTLPASVRVALWGTAALAGHCSAERALQRALPDLDHVEGLVQRWQLWADLGEQVVCVALPRPGKPTLLPRSEDGLAAAAMDAGECVFVPALGGALVPEFEEFGPAGDTGWTVTWQHFDADPVPTHALAALDEREIDRSLREHLAVATQALDGLDAAPWSPRAVGARDELESLQLWGLPPGLSGRAVRLIQMAGMMAAAAETGLAHSDADVTAHARRERVLLDLLASAESALAAAATTAALGLAGLRHAGA